MAYKGYNPLATLEIALNGNAADMLEDLEPTLETATSELAGSE